MGQWYISHETEGEGGEIGRDRKKAGEREKRGRGRLVLVLLKINSERLPNITCSIHIWQTLRRYACVCTRAWPYTCPYVHGSAYVRVCTSYKWAERNWYRELNVTVTPGGRFIRRLDLELRFIMRRIIAWEQNSLKHTLNTWNKAGKIFNHQRGDNTSVSWQRLTEHIIVFTTLRHLWLLMRYLSVEFNIDVSNVSHRTFL